MSPQVSRILDAATQGGYEITPAAIAVAIRAALMESRDSKGQPNISNLYQLTCELERTKL